MNHKYSVGQRVRIVETHTNRHLREQRDELAELVKEMIEVLATERRTPFRYLWLARAREAVSGL